MLISLPVLIFSLLAVSPPRPSAFERATPNAQRAKRGLLPRKSAPSRVVDLAGAAGRRAELQAIAQSLIVDDPGARSAAEPVPAAAQVEEPAPAAAQTEGAGPAAAEDPAPAASAAEPARIEAAREVQRQGGPRMRASQGEAAQARTVQEEAAADRARDEAVSVSVLTEMSIDARGRIIERRMRRDLQLLSVRVLGRVDELPVLSSERLEDGRIRERVDLAGSTLEVLRDPVGRFLSARAAPGPDEDDEEDGDAGEED